MNRPLACPPQHCPPGWADEAMACWDELQRLQQIITSTMAPDIQKLQIAINNLSTQVTNITNNVTPVKGVTDGSNAAAGNVGEFIQNNISVPFAAYPAITDTTVPLITIPAGDWSLSMYMDTSSGGSNPVPIAVGAFSSWIAIPAPAGLTNNLTMVQYPFVAGMTADSIVSLNSCVARGNFSVATPLSVRVVVNQSSESSLLGGNVMMYIEARRVR